MKTNEHTEARENTKSRAQQALLSREKWMDIFTGYIYQFINTLFQRFYSALSLFSHSQGSMTGTNYSIFNLISPMTNFILELMRGSYSDTLLVNSKCN